VNSDLAISARGLVKVFNRGQTVRALDGFDLEVKKGTVTGLLGPNGSGKTTAVRILSTILSPDEGTAEIMGLDVVRQSDAVRRTIGLAGQYATVDENLTGRENIRMVAQLTHLTKAAARTKADELLERFKLTEAGDRPAKTYSGGMRRRLDLAASLVAEPPVLFLDEPTTGLDPQSRNDLWEIIEELVAGGTTVLLTTQYLEEADRLAQDIVVMEKGRVIAKGTPAELKAQLGTTVIEVSFASHELAERASLLLANLTPKAPIREGSLLELTVEDGPKIAAEVLRTLDGAGVELMGLALREPSLDDVFLSLTGHRTEIKPEQDTAKGRRTRKAKTEEAAQ
jgi:ABC-2 type transport system ATP-binding protein